MRAPSPSARGFTIVEMVVAIGISTVIIGAAAALMMDLITLNSALSGSYTAQNDVRKTFKAFNSELRSITSAATGAYAVESAGAQSLIFYSDIDADGTVDRVRYFISGTTLQKGVIVPTGSPLAYTGTETVTNLVTNVSNGASALFDYYGSSYNGSGSSLTQPVSANVVRHVKLTLIVDPGSNRPLGPQTYVTQVTLRNLKDNL